MRSIAMGLYVALVSALALPCSAQERESPNEELKKLEWLSGHWQNRQGDKLSEEVWLQPRAGMMLGLNRSIRGRGKTAFEYLRIERRSAGIVYIASPSGRSSTEFTLKSLGENEVVFENPNHDFPQQILYRRNDRQLTASIRGTLDGQTRSMQWTWTLAAPPARATVTGDK